MRALSISEYSASLGGPRRGRFATVTVTSKHGNVNELQKEIRVATIVLLAHWTQTPLRSVRTGAWLDRRGSLLEAKANWLGKKKGARHIATLNGTLKEMTHWHRGGSGSE